MPKFRQLKPRPGAKPSRGPWRITDDGTVLAGRRKVVCVLGAPEESFTEQDVVNGALILASLHLLGAAREALELLDRRFPNIILDAKDSLRLAIAKAEGK